MSKPCPEVAAAGAARADSTHGRPGAESARSQAFARDASAALAGQALVTDDDSGSAARQGGQHGRETRPRRPSLGGGIPARERELGTQGRMTVRRLLEAGLAEFDEKGFQAVRVDDVVNRAKTSHGTFYLYFANKDDLFRTLLRDALHDMEVITDEFPVVTSNEVGRVALRDWIQKFSDTYLAHATVIRILSQADIVGEEVYGDGLRLLFWLSEAIAQGMTAAAGGQQRAAQADDTEPSQEAESAVAEPGSGQADRNQRAELTALACLMMLERINYLLSVEVRLPREEMIDRLSAIIYAAFQTP